MPSNSQIKERLVSASPHTRERQGEPSPTVLEILQLRQQPPLPAKKGLHDSESLGQLITVVRDVTQRSLIDLGLSLKSACFASILRNSTVEVSQFIFHYLNDINPNNLLFAVDLASITYMVAYTIDRQYANLAQRLQHRFPELSGLFADPEKVIAEVLADTCELIVMQVTDLPNIQFANIDIVVSHHTTTARKNADVQPGKHPSEPPRLRIKPVDRRNGTKKQIEWWPLILDELKSLRATDKLPTAAFPLAFNLLATRVKHAQDQALAVSPLSQADTLPADNAEISWLEQAAGSPPSAVDSEAATYHPLLGLAAQSGLAVLTDMPYDASSASAQPTVSVDSAEATPQRLVSETVLSPQTAVVGRVTGTTNRNNQQIETSRRLATLKSDVDEVELELTDLDQVYPNRKRAPTRIYKDRKEPATDIARTSFFDDFTSSELLELAVDDEHLHIQLLNKALIEAYCQQLGIKLTDVSIRNLVRDIIHSHAQPMTSDEVQLEVVMGFIGLFWKLMHTQIVSRRLFSIYKQNMEDVGSEVVLKLTHLKLRLFKNSQTQQTTFEDFEARIWPLMVQAVENRQLSQELQKYLKAMFNNELISRFIRGSKNNEEVNMSDISADTALSADIEESVLQFEEDWEAPPIDEAKLETLFQQLDAYIALLENTLGQQALIEMYLRRYSYRQMHQVLTTHLHAEIKESTIKSRLHRALIDLYVLIESSDPLLLAEMLELELIPHMKTKQEYSARKRFYESQLS